jgi:hypothetical protein
MSRLYVFADEAGCFTLERNGSASRYFILCTVAMRDCAVSDDLLDLRRRLLWEGIPLGDYYHATDDRQIVRDRVFATLGRRAFSVQR